MRDPAFVRSISILRQHPVGGRTRFYKAHRIAARFHVKQRSICVKMAAGKTVLIDMDNTLAQFDLEFGKRWAQEYPGGSLELIQTRKHFELEQNFPDDPEAKNAAIKIMSSPGLYIAFEPAVGSVEAVKEMVAAGLAVFFCTAPHPFQYESCVAEKYSWVRKHFGEEFLSRIIITRDKTVIKGTVLIDDKPSVSGACDKPEWTHILYTQSYNLHLQDKPRFTRWNEWRRVLSPYLHI